jgi:hypothetical protein
MFSSSLFCLQLEVEGESQEAEGKGGYRGRCSDGIGKRTFSLSCEILQRQRQSEYPFLKMLMITKGKLVTDHQVMKHANALIFCPWL